MVAEINPDKKIKCPDNELSVIFTESLTSRIGHLNGDAQLASAPPCKCLLKKCQEYWVGWVWVRTICVSVQLWQLDWPKRNLKLSL